MEKSETLRVKGMFCVNCEKRIRKALINLNGVENASANFQKGTVDVTWLPDFVSESEIIRCIEAEGYTVADSGAGLQIISILIIILALYMIASRLGWTNVFNLFPRVETTLSLGMLFVIGLMTSVHCIAMCGGINLTQSTLSVQRNEALLKSTFEYNTGRVVSYTVIGCIAGGIGSILTFSGALKGAAAIFAGIIMVIMAMNMLGVFLPLRKFNIHLPSGIYRGLSGVFVRNSSFVIGLLNGLIPCGPLQSMQIYALSTGSIWKGGLSMFLFSLGTMPLMLGFGLFSGRLNRSYAKYMLNISAVIIFVMGIHMLGNGLSLSGAQFSFTQRNEGRMAMLYDGKVQKIETEIDHGSYPPFSVRAGLPVE